MCMRACVLVSVFMRHENKHSSSSIQDSHYAETNFWHKTIQCERIEDNGLSFTRLFSFSRSLCVRAVRHNQFLFTQTLRHLRSFFCFRVWMLHFQSFAESNLNDKLRWANRLTNSIEISFEHWQTKQREKSQYAANGRFSENSIYLLIGCEQWQAVQNIIYSENSKKKILVSIC